MKTNRFVGLLSAAALATTAAFAADKEVTLTGVGQCAKCELGKTDACQNALVVKQGGKEEMFLLVDNDVSKKFHDNICTGKAEIQVTGVVKESAGKKEIVASKIELAKK
jgi:hypothetical protein